MTVLHSAPKFTRIDGLKETLSKALGAMLIDAREEHGELLLTVQRDAIEDALRLLHDDHGYQQLMEIAGVDYPSRPERFEVVYMLLSLTENSRKALRLDALNDLGDQSMITFPAKDEKYVLTVFTDIDCGYCRKLHREMGDYNDRGITVRYLFYPRSGPDTPSFDKAESVWCSKDQNDAMTQAKMGANVSAKACENPVQAHYEAGQRLGVRGTPALIMPDGSVQPGYLPADRLLTLLERS